MTLLALWLLTLGLADLVRGSTDAKRRTGRAVFVSALVVIAVGAHGDLSLRGFAVAFVLVVGSAWIWLATSAAALRGWTPVSRPLAVLGVSALLLLAFSGSTPVLGGRLAGWYGSLGIPQLANVPFERFAFLLGSVAFLQVTSNIVVRLALDGAGSPALKAETSLRGGRVLGPMERTFIFALGLAGQLTAASIIVAAKGLLRFPEIQSKRDDPGVDQLTEYFLVGSMASWLLALAFLPLT